MASCVLLYCVVLHDLFTYTAARVANKLTYIQGGPKKSKPKTHDHNFVKS